MAVDVDAYRDQVRRFIAERGVAMDHEGVRVPRDAEHERAIRAWLASLYDEGYLGGGWPEQWGGRPGHVPVLDLVLMEELILGDAYRPLDQVMLAAHAVIEFGTDAQRRELLPKVRSGEHVWCQLFSEPDAGSDLASLRTRAEPDGDGFVVTGQKIWSTDAQWADMAMLLARTDPAVDRHAGITAFVVPMGLPGIDVRPIREMTGYSEFCEVFLDGVRLGAEHVLGEVNDGWRVVSSGLASERAFVGANAVQLERMFRDLVALASVIRLPDGTAAIGHEDVQAQLAEALVRVEEVKLIVRDTVNRILDDDEHPSDGPVAKLAYTETNVALCELALDMIGSAASVDDQGAEVVDCWYHNYLWSRALTISGGASEIMRGLIGRQLLGLPPRVTTMRLSPEDDAEIRNLLARYCVLLDQDDVDAWIELFTPDATYLVYGRTFAGPDGLRKMMTGAPGGLHLGGPPALDAVDADHATAQQNLLFIERTTSEMRRALYDDDLVRTSDGWRIASRRCRFITAEGLRDRPDG